MGSPFIGAGTVVTYRFFTSAAAKTFWRVKIADIDSDEDELNDAEEESIGTNTNLRDSDEDGIPDGWEAKEGLDPLNSADAQSDLDGDGLTNLDEFQGGTHANEHDLIIIVEREMISSGSQVVESRDEEGNVTWDGFWSDGSAASARQSHESFANVISNRNSITYHGDWSPAMSAGELGHGGIWLHPDGLQGSNHTYDLSHSDANGNEFRMTGHGASKFKIRLKRNQSNGPEMTQVYYVVVFTQGDLSAAAEIQPLGFTFAENQIYSTELEFKSDVGHAVIGLARPVVTAAFGLGPDAPEWRDPAEPKASRELLESYLNLIKIIRFGDIWAVKDSQSSPKVQLVEIATSQQKLNEALATRGQFVVFDGHSNYGVGPNFGGNDVSRLSDFTNYGDKYTDVPLNFQLTGSLSDPSKWGSPFKSLVVMHDEIPNKPINYKPVRMKSLRFPNNDNVDENEEFPVDGEGINMWHYHNKSGEKRLLIKAMNTDLPSKLRYDTFFYNACSSGIDYIENFRHGNFLFTTDTCAVYQGTKVFMKGVIEGKTPKQIIQLLNQPLIGTPDEGVIIYEIAEFKK